MERYIMDCRDFPSDELKCSVAISADSKEELLEIALQHAEKVHGYEDTPEVREALTKGFTVGRGS